MSKMEILTELPKLDLADRREIFERICEMEERDLINGGATPEEKGKGRQQDQQPSLACFGEKRRGWFQGIVQAVKTFCPQITRISRIGNEI